MTTAIFNCNSSQLRFTLLESVMIFKTVRRIAMSASVAVMLFAVAPLSADMGMKGHGDMMGGKMMEHMMKKLELTDDQAKQMKALHKADQDANKALMDKMETDIASLKALLKKKASDADLSALISTLKDDHKAMQEAMQANHEAMMQILTPVQQAKMVLHMHEHMQGMMDMGGMGMKGHGDDDEHEHEGKDKDKDEKAEDK